MAKVAFSDDIKMDYTREDADDQTNMMLLREKNTFSRARLQRLKMMSVITGNYTSRKKVFSEIQEHADYKTYEILVHGKTILCAKVFNPALLGKNSKTWGTLSDIQRFELEDPEGILTTIPKHYATNMPHLESFSITWTRVKSLPNEIFHERLRTLSLQRNNIKTLNGIEKAVNLSSLDVSSNLLTELPKTFGQLQSLNTLNISGNAIKELPFNFGSLTQLRMLDCSCNRLSSLPETIENLLELTSLDVCNNHLIAFPENIGNMPKLEDLRARGNQLHDLPKRFGRLIRLGSLILRKNKFEDVPSQLSNISSLQSLNMRENSIRSFPKAIPSLKTLILDSNLFEEIDAGVLNCCNVQMLSLENNRIKSIPPEIRRLCYLRVLHLSGNPVEEIPYNIEELVHLRHLSLRGTEIRELPMSILNMENLAQLDIDECSNLTDTYLRKELRENGISGLKSYMKQNHLELSKKPQQITKSSTCRDTVLPSSFSDPQIIKGIRDTIVLSDLSDSSRSNSSDQQSSVLDKTIRETIFQPIDSVNNQSKSKRKDQESEQIRLSPIGESPNQDDFAAGKETEYGTVNKSKNKGQQQQQQELLSEDEERLKLADSGMLIRQRLEATENEGATVSNKRQSHV